MKFSAYLASRFQAVLRVKPRSHRCVERRRQAEIADVDRENRRHARPPFVLRTIQALYDVGPQATRASCAVESGHAGRSGAARLSSRCSVTARRADPCRQPRELERTPADWRTG